jgi:hypothetical protein
MTGTLIGVFVTGEGVVVGADSNVAMDAGGFIEIEKTCIVGSRAVATVQGRFGFEHVNGAGAPLIQIFHTSCSELAARARQIDRSRSVRDVSVEGSRSGRRLG